jgi:glycosyltransferase involved in cell wall biosynthesis
MLRGSTAVFSVNACREVRALLDRPCHWHVLGLQPVFEVQVNKEALVDGWALVSFDLKAEGASVDHCILSVNTLITTQRVALPYGGHLRAVVRPSADVVGIHILLGIREGVHSTNIKDGVVSISPVSIRSIGRAEAGLRILIGLVGTRAGNWRQIPDVARTVLKLLRNGGSSAVIRYVLDLYLFSPCALSSFVSTFELFDDDDVSKVSGLQRNQFTWPQQKPSEINDLWSAARFCVDLLRARTDLRRRFPNALSAGASGPFALWLTDEGSRLLGLSPGACEAIRSAFGAGLSNCLRQIYLIGEDLRAAFPLALTPAGRRDFFRWIFNDGRGLPGVRLETIWWFFLESDEDPGAELVRTFLFTPEWQRMFPDGLTVFGRAKLVAWLASFYRLEADWLDPKGWPMVGTAAEHLRLAYACRADWQLEHPNAFKTVQSAKDFLDWLTAGACGLTGEPLAWCMGLDRELVGRHLATGGVNILGHFCFASGLRTSVESISEGAKQAGLGVSLRDIWQDIRDDPRHAQFNGLEFYDTTIIHTQPQPYFEISYARAGLQPREPRTYRIGYWYWELDEIPQSWKVQAAQVDELWTATNFVADAMRKRFDLPVFQIMPGVELPNFRPRSRAYFGLPENNFTFLFVFHMMSVMERKNPIGLIKAYRRAFGGDKGVSLVLKTSSGESHPDQMEEMRAAAAGSGITLVDAIYNKDEMLALMAVADCYVSLHCSEGWGLTMVESMLLGKPVIATGYSGNVDFMDNSNSLLVDYKLITLNRDHSPYLAGSRWAEPSVDHAAQLMRRVYENQDWACELGAKARLDLSERMSLAASGRRIAARLAEIEAKANRRH